MIREIVCFSLLLGCAFALPNGAPARACENMTPGHNQTTPSNLANIYQLEATAPKDGKISGINF